MLEKEIAQTKQFVSNHPAQAFVNEVTRTNNLVSSIESLAKGQKDTGAKLNKISELTPSSIVYKSIDFSYQKNEEITISGTGNRVSILAFYQKAVNDPEIVTTSMPYSNFENVENNDFELKMSW